MNREQEPWKSQGSTDALTDRPVGSKFTNDIHPLFSYELDERHHRSSNKARWGQLTRQEYELLDQPLRLATQWLESASSSDAIWDIIHGERYIPQDNLMHKGLAVFESSRPSSTQETAGNALKGLGKSIMFRLSDRDREKTIPTSMSAITSPILFWYPEGVAITQRSEVKGLACITRINQDYLTALKNLLFNPVKNDFLIRKLYFQFALTISHEVVHALFFAMESKLLDRYIEMGDNFDPGKVIFNEPIHENLRAAEVGYLWEDKVFGGVCLQSESGPEKAMFITEWASWIVRVREEQPGRRVPMKTAYRYLVATSNIRNSQTQEFPDTFKLEHSQDLLALRIRTRVGMICMYAGYGYDRTWDLMIGRCPPAYAGKCFRVLTNLSSQSPCARLVNRTVADLSKRPWRTQDH